MVKAEVEGLARALRAATGGEVRFDNGSRHLYATDASNFRQVPTGVVIPRTVDDLVAVHEVCREFGAPITNRGGGTSLAGQACNAAVVVDSSKYLRRIVDVDPDERRAVTEPGVVLDELRQRTERDHALTWGPDPSTHNRCTMGGSVGNNACGVHAYAYGRADENVDALEVLTYGGERLWVGPTSEDELAGIIAGGGRRGEIYRGLRDLRDRYADLIRTRFPDIPRRVSGYNLTELLPENGFHVARALVGTEGTCVTYLHVGARLNPLHEHLVLAVAGYPDIYAAADHVPLINAWGRATKASALEALDGHLLDNIKAKHLRPGELPDLPEGDAWLLVELHGESAEEARRRADELRALLLDQEVAPDVAVYGDRAQQQVVWGARKAGLGVTARIGNVDHWPGWEDSAVAPDDVPAYLRDLGALFERHGYDVAVYGHLGDGCIHCRIPFDLASEPGRERYRAFLDEAADLCHAYGGSFSGEHGDGQQRGPLLVKMFGSELVQAFREFKAIWDPAAAMNPGKLVDAAPVDANLRLGAGHRPRDPEVRFAYEEDGGSFARATLRCVGLGKCRRADGAGTMCPSYFVTQEEMHSTRGRARLLYEMLRPDAELDGWRDEHVKEALELCLSCKGCTVDCPVGVDMPTYKAEFLHHHYEGRRHPRVHYALGRIDVWSRLAQHAPRLANAALAAPGLGQLLKRAAGVAPD
ncbi:MAG: FAD-binding and (Fe-S)-binding domain-containing protein, partial [Nitriliruptorales bacterium]